MAYSDIKRFNEGYIDESGTPQLGEFGILQYLAVLDLWNGKRHLSSWTFANDYDSAVKALRNIIAKHSSDKNGIANAAVISNCGEVFPFYDEI